MLKNMGTAHRTVRIVIALVVGWLYFTNRVQGTPGIVLLVFAAVYLLPSFAGFCPAYLAFKLSTKGKDQGRP